MVMVHAAGPDGDGDRAVSEGDWSAERPVIAFSAPQFPNDDS
jgi:hypothetical protein